MKPVHAIFAAVLTLAPIGKAEAAVLTATANNSPVSNFFIQFNDTNNNLLFDFNERTFFSGVTVNPSVVGETFYPSLLGVPALSGISNPYIAPEVGTTLEQWINQDSWLFGGSEFGAAEGPSFYWTYSVSGLGEAAVVPLPAGLPLALGGLAALMLLRLRRKAA